MLSKKKLFLSWSLVILCTLSIFLIVPVARVIRNFVESKWGVSVFGYFVLTAVASAFLLCLYLLWFRLDIRALTNYLWLTAIASVYMYFTFKLWARPEEAIHFLEYALLGYLIFKAFQNHIPDKTIFLAAFLLGTMIGIFDEILQWIIPLRYWDLRDVGLNALSVGLCQLAIWKGLKPEIPSKRVKPKSIRIVSWLLAANLLVLGLCSSNTPPRVSSYTRLLPFLSFLEKQEPMNEPKFKHKDPEIGVFFSRLSVQELKRMDTEKADQYSAILKEWAGKKYEDFLINYPGYGWPFLHEMRVHIFRRDQRLSSAQEAKYKKDREKNLFIAFKENQILEKYFKKTLQKSPHKWRSDRHREIEEEIDTTAFYKSPVSASTRIPLTEKILWGAIFLILIFLVYLNIHLSRKSAEIAF